jgi:hypothetical protein
MLQQCQQWRFQRAEPYGFLVDCCAGESGYIVKRLDSTGSIPDSLDQWVIDSYASLLH